MLVLVLSSSLLYSSKISIDRSEEKNCELKLSDDFDDESQVVVLFCRNLVDPCLLSTKSPFVFEGLGREKASKGQYRPPGEIQNSILCLRSFDTLLSNRDGQIKSSSDGSPAGHGFSMIDDA
mmetsp:Transcript_57537/g.140515  ORF Transcript_57537/g.140515 Transcript_57537/m.140515 type:complete len:122 (+) Transcript_57537:1732-2097(+)